MAGCATYVIHRINAWFARVAFEEDAWDESLEEASESGVGAVVLIALLTRFCVFCTRLLLRCLMYTAHAISCFMSRRMEFDADRFEIAVVGSREFAAIFERLTLLGVAAHGALSRSREMWSERRLPDSLPGLAMNTLAQIPEGLRAEILSDLDGRSRRIFSTHPRTSDRIRAAERLAEPGIFTIDAPATVLFRDFRAACIRATYDEFKEHLGEQIMQATFVPTETVIAEGEHAAQAHEALRRFVRGLLDFQHPVRIGPSHLAPPDQPNAAARRLVDLTEELDANRGDLEAAHARMCEALKRAHDLDRAEATLGAGIRMGLQRFGVSPPKMEVVDAERLKIGPQLRESRGRVERAQELNGTRLRLALSLVLHTAMDRRMGDAPQLRERIARLVPLLQQLEHSHGAVLGLQQTILAIEAVSDGLRRESRQPAVTRFLALVDQARGRLHELRLPFLDTPYPFDHARGEVSVGAYLLDREPAPTDPRAVYAAAIGCVESFSSLHFRILSELAQIAERVEQLAARARAAKASS
ncbi:MAG: hypothetical protein IPJ41_00980 [Phycisphaerales bacterium]|nr:hypothetical protein [Phycisphaerales bacterium]